MKNKRCLKCRRSKPLDDFHHHRKYADGRSGQCKVCSAKYSKARYDSDPEYRQRSIQKAGKWLKAHPERRLAAWHRWRKKQDDDEYRRQQRERRRPKL